PVENSVQVRLVFDGSDEDRPSGRVLERERVERRRKALAEAAAHGDAVVRRHPPDHVRRMWVASSPGGGFTPGESAPRHVFEAAIAYAAVHDWRSQVARGGQGARRERPAVANEILL